MAVTNKVFSLQVSGFNQRKWMATNPGKRLQLIESMGKLISAGLLKLDFTEYVRFCGW